MVEEVRAPKLHATQGTDFPEFSGNNVRQLDEKGRIALPPGLVRQTFGTTAYVSAWRGGSIALWPAPQYAAVLDTVARQEREGLARPGAIETFRRNVHIVSVDSQGRLTLPPVVRERRSIPAGSEVVVEGQGDRLEIRPAPAVADDADDFDDLVDMLDHR